MSRVTKSSLSYFFATVIAVVFLTLFSPEEKSLGSSVRIVYLHGAWVLAAEVTLMAAGLMGVTALANRRPTYHRWSAALGRSGIVFWITYLPLSLWAMQSNWNGLFLAEPRFRLALIFAVTGLLLQLGLWLINAAWLTSLGNATFIVALRIAFSQASNVMHPPPSPIFNSGNYVIIGFFLALNLLAMLAAYFLTQFFLASGQESQA